MLQIRAQPHAEFSQRIELEIDPVFELPIVPIAWHHSRLAAHEIEHPVQLCLEIGSTEQRARRQRIGQIAQAHLVLREQRVDRAVALATLGDIPNVGRVAILHAGHVISRIERRFQILIHHA
jgi:hypothetical protein